MISFPKIGMRAIKTVIAVFVCLVIDYFRKDGIPFYSAIAAVLCMQPDVGSSLKTAINRTIGTFIGGISGMLLMMALRTFFPAAHPLVEYFIIAIALIPLMYITVLIKKPAATYITCVVFLSIAVSHGADVTPYLFALNRIFDTLIGIFVSLAINRIVAPQKNTPEQGNDTAE